MTQQGGDSSPPSVPEAPTPLFTVNELAEYLRITRWTVYRMVRDGELSVVYVGRRLRFKPEDVSAYLENNRAEASPTPERT